MPYGIVIDKIAGVLATEPSRTLSEQNPEIVEQLAGRGTLLDVAQQVLELEPHELQYLEAIPSSLREAIRAAIVEALEQNKAVHVQYSPGYDFEVRLWDYGDAVSIHLSGPYPPSFPRDGYERPG